MDGYNLAIEGSTMIYRSSMTNEFDFFDLFDQLVLDPSAAASARRRGTGETLPVIQYVMDERYPIAEVKGRGLLIVGHRRGTDGDAP